MHCTLADMLFGKDEMQIMGTKCFFLALKLEHGIIKKGLMPGSKNMFHKMVRFTL